MPDTIAVSGVIATDLRNVVTDERLKITSFRLASQQRRFDREQSKWIDTETNWYTIVAFRGLSENAEASLNKGDRVIVRGRLRMRDWTSGERTGMNVEIEADAIGHDLAWGRTTYRKVVRGAAAVEAAHDADAETVRDAATEAAEEAEREPVGAVATPF